MSSFEALPAEPGLTDEQRSGLERLAAVFERVHLRSTTTVTLARSDARDGVRLDATIVDDGGAVIEMCSAPDQMMLVVRKEEHRACHHHYAPDGSVRRLYAHVFDSRWESGDVLHVHPDRSDGVEDTALPGRRDETAPQLFEELLSSRFEIRWRHRRAISVAHLDAAGEPLAVCGWEALGPFGVKRLAPHF